MTGREGERTVLIVEDDPAIARMLSILLRADGFTIRVAFNGLEALASVEELRPDVILLDLQMPVMNGREFFTEFRRRGFETPVIILSAYNAEDAHNELQADGFLEKSSHPDAISELVAAVIARNAA